MNDLLNLVPAINAIEDETEKTEREYKDSLKELRKINQACGGKGKLLRNKACAEDDRPNPDYGTGKSKLISSKIPEGRDD